MPDEVLHVRLSSSVIYHYRTWSVTEQRPVHACAQRARLLCASTTNLIDGVKLGPTVADALSALRKVCKPRSANRHIIVQLHHYSPARLAVH